MRLLYLTGRFSVCSICVVLSAFFSGIFSRLLSVCVGAVLPCFVLLFLFWLFLAVWCLRVFPQCGGLGRWRACEAVGVLCLFVCLLARWV